MKFLHKFQSVEAFNKVYYPESQEEEDDGRFVIAIVVGGVTYTYSEPGPDNYYIWVNGDDWVDSDGVRHPQEGGTAYIMGQDQTTIDSVILQEADSDSDSEVEEIVTYSEPWTSWIVGGDVVYNKYRSCAIDANGYGYVDLGLPSGTLWATCNVDANNPEETGGYYAFGETTTKSDYSQNTYTYDHTNLSLEREYDVVYVNMGGTWHMPSVYQLKELLDNTEVTYDVVNNVGGKRFTASNGNSIFIPFGGRMNGTTKDSANSLLIHSTTSNFWYGTTHKVYSFRTDGGNDNPVYIEQNNLIYYGYNVRGVMDKYKGYNYPYEYEQHPSNSDIHIETS